MRALMMLAFLSFFIATVASTPSGTSHISHVGGFLCGLFPSFLFLPNLRRWTPEPRICRQTVTLALGPLLIP